MASRCRTSPLICASNSACPPILREWLSATLIRRARRPSRGLQQRDVIESISRQPVHSVADFERLAAQAKGETLLRIPEDSGNQ